MRKLFAGMLVAAGVLAAVQAAARADVPAVTHYLGTMDGKIAISLALDDAQRTTWSEAVPLQTVSGSYLYCLYGKELNFSGKRVDDETSARNLSYKLTMGAGAAESFDLARDASGKLTGVWKSADGKRKLPVALMPVAKTVTIVSAKSDAYEIRSGYLQFTAQTPFLTALNARLEKEGIQRHNSTLKDMAADAEQEKTFRTLVYSNETHPTVLYVSDTLVSTRSMGYSYTGGAHGNWGYGASNYAWVNGKVVEISPEMIVPKDKWPALRDLCVKHLQEQGASNASDVKFEKDRSPTITFTGSGLLLTFDPYEAGAYAEGAYVVSLPWAEAKAMIAPGSVVAGLLPR